MTRADRRIAATATGQLGSFTRQQAHAAGLTDRQLRGRVQSGFLEQVGTNTFRSPTVRHSPRGDLVALLLDIGEPCWASGPTAAALHGFDGFALRPPFHVTIPRDRDVKRVGHRIHTTIDLPLIDRAHIGEIPVTSAARTLIELARTTDPAGLTAALDAGLRDGRFSEDLLHRRIVALRSKGRYGIPKLLDVIEGIEVIRGGHSWLEREFLRLIAAAGLPRPNCQVVLTRAGTRLVRVDCWFPGTNIVVELLGYRFHRTKAQLTRDADRVNALILDGFRPFQFTYDQVVSTPAVVTGTLHVAFLRSA
jgi:hypothetical protein